METLIWFQERGFMKENYVRLVWLEKEGIWLAAPKWHHLCKN